MPTKSTKRNIGRKNAVRYPYTLPTRIVAVQRYYRDIHDMRYDPENPRLATKLTNSGQRRTQAALNELLTVEVNSDQLVESLRVSGGINNPLVITEDGTPKEGNRRLCAYRILDAEGKNQDKFRYIPVEELPKDITDAEIGLLLLIRHVRQEKSWATLDRVRQIREQLKYYSEEDICSVLNRNKTWLQQYLYSGDLYEEYYDFTADRKSSAEGTVQQDKLWTYFWKMASKPHFSRNVLSNASEREKIFGWIHDGKLNDCLNMDKFPQIMASPAARDTMDGDGGTFKEAMRVIDRNHRERREAEFWPKVKLVKNAMKSLPKRERIRLSTPEGQADRNLLVQLRNHLENVLLDSDPRPSR